MSLIEHTTPAERERGCSLAEGFESQAKVEADGWTVGGAPTFSARDGVTLDGAADYLTKPLTGSEFDSDEISIVVEFTPDFAPTEDVTRYLLDADKIGSNRIILIKNGSARLYALDIYCGGTQVGSILTSTYGGKWKTDQKNILVISAKSGDTSAWLNGENILSSSPAAFSFADINRLTVGARYSGVNTFKGTIHRIQVYKTKLEDQEAIDICNGDTYRYLDDASLILTGAMEDHDPTAGEVTDRSPAGQTVTLGDGAGTGAPTKIASHGYDFDGADDYLGGLPALTGAYTVSILDQASAGAEIEITHETAVSVYTDIGTSGGYSRRLLALVVCPEVLTSLQRADLERRLRSWARRP